MEFVREIVKTVYEICIWDTGSDIFEFYYGIYYGETATHIPVATALLVYSDRVSYYAMNTKYNTVVNRKAPAYRMGDYVSTSEGQDKILLSL